MSISEDHGRAESIPGLDIVSHDVYERAMPFDAYDRFRREAPVAWVAEGSHNGHHGAGFWSLTRWQDVVDVHKDWRTFSSELGGTEIEEMEADAIVARRTMLETDPPRHTRLRQLVNPAFAKPTMERYADGAHRLPVHAGRPGGRGHGCLWSVAARHRAGPGSRVAVHRPCDVS